MYKLTTLLIAAFVTSPVLGGVGHETDLNIRFASLDRSFENQASDRRQTGTGVILRHTLKSQNEQYYLSIGGYAAQVWESSGSPAEDVFKGSESRVRGFSQIGEAFIGVDLSDTLLLRFGRLKHQSLLLKSKTRALPSTFQGLQLNWNPKPNLELYGAWFNKWSRRASNRFTDFTTEFETDKTIDWLALGGLKAKVSHIDLNLEYIESSNFVRKAGITAKASLFRGDQISLSGDIGAFVSRDAGALFKAGATNALDTLRSQQSGRLKHRGLGYYLRAFVDHQPHRIEIAYSAFGEPWLEDSFAKDHGTTPFPTRTFGPELTNRNEQVWLIGYRYQLESGYLKGLSASVKFANGSGAENSISNIFGTASEQWALVDLKYKPPKLENLTLRFIHRDYRSTIAGSVAGVADDRSETRFFIDYQHLF